MPAISPAFSRYLLSLPERVVRSLTAVAGGVAREVGHVAIPAAIRRTRLYQTMVESTLRFLIEQVGQVADAYPGEDKLADNFLVRRTAGNGIEMIGVLTFRASPVWVMAALADVSGAGQKLIREIAGALQDEGLLERGRNFDTVEQMLSGLERTSARIAETFNTPPLDIATLRSELAAIRDDAKTIAAPVPSPDTLWQAWRDLQSEAANQKRSVFELSSALALSAVSRLPESAWKVARSGGNAARRTGAQLASALLDHYTAALGEMRRQGFGSYWVAELRPYLRAALQQFSPKRASLTQKLLRKATQ